MNNLYNAYRIFYNIKHGIRYRDKNCPICHKRMAYIYTCHECWNKYRAFQDEFDKYYGKMDAFYWMAKDCNNYKYFKRKVMLSKFEKHDT